MDTMKPVAWGAFRDGVLLPQSVTTDEAELRFEAAGTWIGCELRPLYVLPDPSAGVLQTEKLEWPGLDCVQWAERLIRQQLPEWALRELQVLPRTFPEPKPVAWTDKIGLEYLARGYGIDVSAEAGSVGRKIPLYADTLPVVRYVRAALHMLKLISEEAERHLTDARDAVAKNNIGYYAKQAVTALTSIKAQEGADPVASPSPAAATVDEEMVERARLEFSTAVLDPAVSVDEMWRRTLTAALTAASEKGQ